MFVVMKSNTVVEPDAVMVHFKDTSVTFRTVMSSWWLFDFAFSGKLVVKNDFDEYRQYLFFFASSRVGGTSPFVNKESEFLWK